MARPERNNVDYFPFLCSEGKKMFYLEETYGNDGFAVFVKLLRELAKTEYHYLNLSENTTLMFLSAKCKVSKEKLELIIKDLVDLGKFNAELWNENKVIWCQDFIDSIQDAYFKRKNKCITLEGLFHLLTSLGIRKQSKKKLKAPVKPQSIEEDIKKEYRIFDHLKISIEENEKLISFGYTQKQIDSVYDSIENFKHNTKYKSLYLTAKKWLEKEHQKSNPEQPIKLDTSKLK